MTVGGVQRLHVSLIGCTLCLQKVNHDFNLLVIFRSYHGDSLFVFASDFCSVNGQIVSLFSRVQDQAVESYAMKEVFSMESHVRIEAIENLGKNLATRNTPVYICAADVPAATSRRCSCCSL